MKPALAATFATAITAIVVGFAHPFILKVFFDTPASAAIVAPEAASTEAPSIDYPEVAMWRPVIHSTRGGTAPLPDLLTPSACRTLIAAANGSGTAFTSTICYHIETGEIIRPGD